MPLKKEEVVLLNKAGEESTYIIIQKPASVGEILRLHLAKLLAPLAEELPVLLAKFKDIDLDLAEEDTRAELLSLIAKLIQNNDPTSVFQYINQIIQGTKKDGVLIDQGNIDEIFTGEPKLLYSLAAACTKVNFADF